MSKLEFKDNKSGIIDVPVGTFSFHIGASTAENWTTITSTGFVNWESDSQMVDGKEIVPYGANNNLPAEIRKVMDENNLAPGILEREKGLLWGQGPKLYTEIIENSDIKREWIQDNEVMDWLLSWDFEKYLQHCIVDYKYLQGFFTKFFRNRGARIGRDAKISKLSFVPANDARLGWVDTRRLEDVSKIIVGDFENNCNTGSVEYPVFDLSSPFRYPISMMYSNSYSFARNFYSMPSFYGTLNWIKRSSDIPQILKALTDNSLNIKWHIISPKEYWDNKAEVIRKNCELKGIQYKESMLDVAKNAVFEELTKVLSGKTNVGKFFHSVAFKDDEGTLQKWEIIPIDQKVKDFIEAQIKISEKADSATTSGIGLHPSLSNIMVDGKLSSGSEMLYALKLYLASDTTIPESIVTQAINTAIRVNFPNKNVKVGFYHKIVLREEEVSPQNRTTNAI